MLMWCGGVAWSGVRLCAWSGVSLRGMFAIFSVYVLITHSKVVWDCIVYYIEH